MNIKSVSRNLPFNCVEDAPYIQVLVIISLERVILRSAFALNNYIIRRVYFNLRFFFFILAV